MDLQIFNSKNCMAEKILPSPTVSISKKGMVTFSRLACDVLELAPDDRVVFYQDNSRPKDWYVEKDTMKDKDGFTLKVKTSKNGGGTVFFNSLVLTTFIFKSLDIYENTKFNISREPCPKSFKYAIITRAQKRGRKPNPQ